MITKALQFGGGKDSLACLHLLRPEWDDMYVCWLNTGAAFPETLALMDEVRAMVPHFVEVRTDVQGDIARNGWPVDVVPVTSTEHGAALTGAGGIRLRPWLACCRDNFWAPLDARMHALGVTEIIRGQRITEHYKSTIRDGHVEGGITYRMPIQDWTEGEVFAFLTDNNIPIPAYYEDTNTSLDCWLCTAYLDAKGGQLRYMRKHHPEKYAAVRDVLKEIGAATRDALAPLAEALT